MRYSESKEQSAGLLRLALAEMAQHDAALNPVTYAVWYEYLAGINPRLTGAMQTCRQQSPRLGDDAVRTLYRDHVAELDTTAAARVSGDLQQLMQGVADAAARTGDTAGAFGEKLHGLSTALQSRDAAALAPHLADAAAHTAKMQQSVSTLQSRLDDSRRQIEELRADLQRVRDEALTCPLSGVLNRKGFDQALAEVLSRRPAKGHSHCLVMLDLDHFKRVNDTHGHVVGDTVIRLLGQLLRRTAVGSGVHCARYGGEEFAIVMADTTVAQAHAMAESVRQLTRALKVRHRTTQEVLLTVTISAGVAAWTPGDDATTLVASADAALYRSKQSGRDRVTVA